MKNHFFEAIIAKTETKAGRVYIEAANQEEAECIANNLKEDLLLELEDNKLLNGVNYDSEVNSVNTLSSNDIQMNVKVVDNEIICEHESNIQETIEGILFNIILHSDDTCSGFNSEPESHLFIAEQQTLDIVTSPNVTNKDEFISAIQYGTRLSSYVNKAEELSWDFVLNNLPDMFLAFSGLHRVKENSKISIKGRKTIVLDAHEEVIN